LAIGRIAAASDEPETNMRDSIVQPPRLRLAASIRRWRLRAEIEAAVLFLPALVLVVIFKLYPLVVGVATSFTTPKGVLNSTFVGLANYQRSLTDEGWITAVQNAAKLMLLLPIVVTFPLLVATVIFYGIRAWKYFRAIFFLSWLLPPVAVGQMFNPMFGLNGPVNAWLANLGIEPIQWLGSTTLAPIVFGAVIVWSWFGLGTGIYLAGYATIPDDEFDAASIDGAGPWSVLWHVSVPRLLPTISYWTVLCTSSLLLGLFPYVLALTHGGPARATMLPEYFIWDTTIRFNPGYTSALGIELFMIIAVVVAIQVWVMFGRVADA
jgi:raffinose/stachyose/melibiose transport system permease protein